MGIQFIFVVETNKKCNSDWIYIKETVDQFYSYEQTKTKFTPIYMDGKGNYMKKLKEIETKKRQFRAASKSNQSRVIYCFDCDEFDRKSEDLKFLSEARKFCKKEGYEFVWFCKDIEHVYIGKRIEDSQKKKEAANFKARKLISKIDRKRLSEYDYKVERSNILEVLDRYPELIRRDERSRNR